MSTSPDIHAVRADDEIVTLLSEWLAFHLSNGQLRERLAQIDLDELRHGQLEAVDELMDELDSAAPAERGDLEMVVRETLEAVALG